MLDLGRRTNCSPDISPEILLLYLAWCSSVLIIICVFPCARAVIEQPNHWLSQRVSTLRPFLVKVHRSNQRLVRAFRHELHALLRARHPHIVRLFSLRDQT